MSKVGDSMAAVVGAAQVEGCQEVGLWEAQGCSWWALGWEPWQTVGQSPCTGLICNPQP